VTIPGQNIVASILLGGLVVLGVLVAVVTNSVPLFLLFVAVALLTGVALVMPIGGADMPVVISLLNSYTGIAVAATGFVLGNYALLIAGTLVGASGAILTQLMTKAMNRSLVNVLFGAFGTGGGVVAAGEDGEQHVREISAEDAAVLMAYGKKVIVVPGYGMAVAQAQGPVRELMDLLVDRGVEVEFAIHPVAGRMPGHMNVLLAEANVPYERLKEMDEINEDFREADVALVIGANDVTNPAARNDQSSPIYGMPILNVDQAKNVVVLKRSMAAGFAGIPNPLYGEPETAMLFGDAKKSVEALVAGVKAA
jgi:H+-translocating NAD(P) transhydrogenase subunit beta